MARDGGEGGGKRNLAVLQYRPHLKSQSPRLKSSWIPLFVYIAPHVGPLLDPVQEARMGFRDDSPHLGGEGGGWEGIRLREKAFQSAAPAPFAALPKLKSRTCGWAPFPFPRLSSEHHHMSLPLLPPPPHPQGSRRRGKPGGNKTPKCQGRVP